MRKTLIVIFTLAFLATGLSCLRTEGWSNSSGSYFGRGFPLAFYEEMSFSQGDSKVVFDRLPLLLNLLFWASVILAAFLVKAISIRFYRGTGRVGLCSVVGVVLLAGSLWGVYHFSVSRGLEDCTVPYFREDLCELVGSGDSEFCQRSVKGTEKGDDPGVIVPPSLARKVPQGIELHLLPIGLAGGDVLAFPIIEVGNRVLPKVYCQATDKNYGRLFAPLARDEVLDYLDFRFITLSGSSYGRLRHPISSLEEFESAPCWENPEKDDVEADYCEVEETSEFFVVNWVYYTGAGESGIYRQKIKVKKTAGIEYLTEVEKLLFCGPGIMF